MQTIQRIDHIKDLDLRRYLRKLALRDPVKWTPEMLRLADREYRRFLDLRRLGILRGVVPSEIMDAVWHEHILDTRNYAIDMERIFGAFVHHEPNYGDDAAITAEMEGALRLTVQAYRDVFGEEMPGVDVARCSGKKCHAPTSCRCR
jgi:hypothetical protein